MLQADFIADGLVPDAPPTLPPALRAVENLLTTSAINAANTLFLNTNAKPFRIFLDDACNMPSDWRSRSVSDESKYSADLHIPRMLAASPFVTSDWQQADASIVVLVARRFGGPVVAAERCRRILERTSAAWRATRGSRHFFILTADRGPCCNDGKLLIPQFLRHHIVGHHGELAGHHWRYASLPGSFAGTESSDVGCFHAHKDVSIPTPNQRTRPASALAGRGDRNLLVFYAGGGRFTINRAGFRGVREGRRMLLSTFYNRSDADVLVVPSMPADEYRRTVQRARFCPIMGGFAPWSPRLVEVMMAGCVPVVFSSWLLPFSRLIDWSKCSVRVSSLTDVPRLREILAAQDYDALAAGVAAARHALWYQIGDYTGEGMLPLLLLEMRMALNEADVKPLASRVSELLGAAAEPELSPQPWPQEKGSNSSTAAVFRVGQTSISTERNGVRRRWECAPVFGSRVTLSTSEPAELYERHEEQSAQDANNLICKCMRTTGPRSDEPISPTQRLLGPQACTGDKLAAAVGADSCTRFAGQPDDFDHHLRPSPPKAKMTKAPFNGRGCDEAYCAPHCLNAECSRTYRIGTN